MRAVTAILVASLFVPPPALSAQSIWVGQRTDKAVALEILKPSFDGDDYTTLTTSVVFASLRMPAGNGLRVVVELPFAHYGFDSDFGGDSDNTIGNPYLGLEIGSPDSPMFGEIGIRAPLTSDDNNAGFVGRLADMDRWEAFATDFVPITGVLNYRSRNVSGFVTRFRGGLAAWINTEGEDSEVLAAYSGQVGYESRRVSVLGGLAGRAILTEEGLDFGERTVHEVRAAVNIGLGAVRPGVHVRVPLDEDMKDFLDVVFGLNVSIKLR